jgi:hypothetical protein
VGDNFAPVCKYQYGFFIFQFTWIHNINKLYRNWYKNSKGWWVRDDYKPWRCSKSHLSLLRPHEDWTNGHYRRQRGTVPLRL